MMTAVVLPAVVQGAALRQLRNDLLTQLRTDPVLVVEAGDVQHLSDAAQAVLITAHRAASAHGGRLHLRHPSPAVILALRSSGLLHLIDDTADRRLDETAAVPGE